MSADLIRNKIIGFAVPVIFFLLPWQTRWIFVRQQVAGHDFEYGVISLYAVEVLIALALIVYWRLQIKKEYEKQIGFVFLFLIFVSITAVFAFDTQLAFGQMLHVFFALVLFLLLLDQRTCLKKVSIAFFLGLLAPILLGFWQVVAGFSWSSTIFGLAQRDAQALGDAVLTLADGTRILRAYGSFGHPNIFGGYLVICVLSLFAFFKNRYVIILPIISIIFTFSQSAWLALIISLICAFIVYKYFNKLKKGFFWIAGAFSAVILIGSVFVVIAINNFGFDQSSIFERVEQYSQWPLIASESLAIGSGVGNYIYAIENLNPDLQWWEYQPVHNVPMLIVGEIGLVGLILLILWFYEVDKINYSRLPKKGALIALSMGCALLVISGLDHYLWTQWSGLALCAFVMAITVRID
jgi:hypothetical protein